MPRTTDFRTYPGDRPTRLTPTQRETKLRAARALAAQAHALAAEVCADFDANGYRLSHDLIDEWRDAASLADDLRRCTR